MTQRKWSELPPARKGLVVGALALHLCLVVAAHADLTKRPAEQIRGPKALWRVLTAANTSFTVLYLLWGRRKPMA